MKNVCWCAIPIFVITLFVSFADARLPDDGLARAAEAEKALAAGDPQQAIAIFVELDAKYPDEPAVNLRLAEIYDQQGQLGAALFYYRRYVQLAGAKARQSAKERVQTLEMTAGAREAADAVAQKLGQRARPVGTPTPKIEQAIEKLLPDGARVRVDSPEELMSEKVNPKKLVSPTPETSQHPLARAEVIIRDGAPDGETSVPAVVKKTPRAIFTPPPLTSFSSGENQEAKTQSGGTVKESVTPEPIWETPATPRATEKASAAAPPGEPTQLTQNKISVEFAPAERTAFEKAKHPTQSEVAGSSKPSGSPAVSSPTPVRLLANEPGKFFICHPFGGDVARLSLSNELPNAVLVLSALPVLGGDPVNAIVGGGETRSYDVRPGRYVVHVTIRDNSYPPVTLLDTRFDYEFQQGINYARRFSPRDIEGRALRP